MKIEILVGISGSGKSTYSVEKVKNNPGWVRLNRDLYRELLFGAKQSDEGYYTRQDFRKCEELVSQTLDQAMYDILNKNLNIVLDNTHLRPKYIDNVIRKYNHLADIEIKFFDVDLVEAQNRVRVRNGFDFNVDYIKTQYNKFHNLVKLYQKRGVSYPRTNTKIDFHPENEKAIIVDIDGTLAKHNGRSPYDETRVSEDTVINPVAEVVSSMQEKGYKILFVSGRTDSCYKETERWLRDNSLWTDRCQLHMRKTGDTRPDYIIKEEIVKEKISSESNVVAAVDDRMMMVREWERLGVFCFNVNQGLKYF